MNKKDFNKQIQQKDEKIHQLEQVLHWMESERKKEQAYFELFMRIMLVQADQENPHEEQVTKIIVTQDQINQFNRQFKHKIKDGIHTITIEAKPNEQSTGQPEEENRQDQTESNPDQESNSGKGIELEPGTKGNLAVLQSLGNHQASSPTDTK